MSYEPDRARHTGTARAPAGLAAGRRPADRTTRLIAADCAQRARLRVPLSGWDANPILTCALTAVREELDTCMRMAPSGAQWGSRHF